MVPPPPGVSAAAGIIGIDVGSMMLSGILLSVPAMIVGYCWWGIYMRHAKNLEFSNIKLHCEQKDYRSPIVLDDVHASRFAGINITQPGPKKPMHLSKSTGITNN